MFPPSRGSVLANVKLHEPRVVHLPGVILSIKAKMPRDAGDLTANLQIKVRSIYKDLQKLFFVTTTMRRPNVEEHFVYILEQPGQCGLRFSNYFVPLAE